MPSLSGMGASKCCFASGTILESSLSITTIALASPNFLYGLRTLAQECLEEVILNPPEMLQEYIDIAVLHDAFHQSMDQGVAKAALTVWKVATLALWLRSADVSY